MIEYSKLQHLIDELERGNKYHICVTFFGNYATEQLRPDRKNAIHMGCICDFLKSQHDNSYAKCLLCRRFSFSKARKSKKPFGGHCIHGVYEYCYPLFFNGTLVCVIHVGNILRDKTVFCRRSGLSPNDPLLDQMATDLTDEDCKRIAQLVAFYIQATKAQLANDVQPIHINAVISSIQAELDANYSQDIALADIARLYHYNEKYLGRLFKSQVGVSFGQYLNSRRLKKAAELLRQTKDSVLDISQAVGFNNVTYFNRLFQQLHGMSPTQYRKAFLYSRSRKQSHFK